MSGKPGNFREFETCQENVRDYVKSGKKLKDFSLNCQGKNLVR